MGCNVTSQTPLQACSTWQQPIMEALPKDTLESDVRALDASDKLLTLGDYAVYAAPAHKMPAVLREVQEGLWAAPLTPG